jgi:RNA polymerase sigma-70 factor (ECF subfamily)
VMETRASVKGTRRVAGRSCLNSIQEFEKHRSRLFGIAYRMLGSVTDAEDLVQETFLRWQRQSEIRATEAWLTAVITRLSIDLLRSSHHQRETYVGTWLPEPLVTESQENRAAGKLADSLSQAFLVLLETLSPSERAALLLREIFEYDYPEIAQILKKSEDNCRQMVSRAKQRLSSRQPRFRPSAEQAERILHQFLRTCADGDMTGLLELLTDDVVAYTDGGGRVPAAPKPLLGASQVSRFFINIRKNLPSNLQWWFATVNGGPGIVFSAGGIVNSVAGFRLDGDRIREIYIVNNPDKLGRVPDSPASR